MIDSRLRRHELRFLEVADKPTAEQLTAYYADLYYQPERANYRKTYPAYELRYVNLKITQRAQLVNSLRRTSKAGSMLDVGCGERFAVAWSTRGVVGRGHRPQHRRNRGDEPSPEVLRGDWREGSSYVKDRFKGPAAHKARNSNGAHAG